MNYTYKIFENQTYELPQGRRHHDASEFRGTPKKHASSPHSGKGYLSPSSTSLVSPPKFANASILSTVGSSETHLQQISTSGFYCEICSKRFNSEATLKAHFGSERHRKAKTIQRGNFTRDGPLQTSFNSKGSPRKSRGPSSKSQEQPLATSTVALDETLLSMKEANRIANRNPAVAATVLWNISKDLAQYSDQFENLRLSLKTVQKCLGRMSTNTELRGEKGTKSLWTSRTLLKTKLECDMALARLLMTFNEDRAIKEYLSALCEYLGIDNGTLDTISLSNDPTNMSKRAPQATQLIPRKFTKVEDISQALEAMKEVASACLAFSVSDMDNLFVKRGMAVYFLRYAFAQEKGVLGSAYETILAAASALRYLGLDHFGNECAMLIIDHHIDQPDAQIRIAAAIVDALHKKDLIRADLLIQNYSKHFKKPWSQFLARLVAKTIEMDVCWMCDDAWLEWESMMLDKPESDIGIYELIESLLTEFLEPYAWYKPMWISQTAKEN
ncbi:hypothetical protein H4S08_004669 [Coemansia sp. RSA 1365]|nr:hypothetical protein H4S08_004669 [Coemansia sp. RSA 1365]